MIFLGNLTKIMDNQYSIGFIHYMPFDETHGMGKNSGELEVEGVLVDVVPQPENIAGKTATLYVNPQTKELWYEYTDIAVQISPEQQEINQLKDQIATLSTTVDFLLGI